MNLTELIKLLKTANNAEAIDKHREDIAELIPVVSLPSEKVPAPPSPN